MRIGGGIILDFHAGLCKNIFVSQSADNNGGIP